MRIFEVTKRIKVICEALKTRNGFKHAATLMVEGRERDSVKINYLNRTWERYEFQSVLNKLLEETTDLTEKEKKQLKRKIGNQFAENDPAIQSLRTISSVMALGDLFTKNQKDSNDWKERMLKAGLQGRGLIMPEDWDQLDEDTKQARLDGAIGALK